MSRVVITCWGSYGDVYPYVGFAKVLNARGHHSVIAAPVFYRQAVEQEQIEFAAAGPEVDPTDRGVLARAMHPVKGPEAVVRDLVVPAMSQTYSDLQRASDGADLIVGHPLTFAAPMVAQIRGLRFVSTVLAPLGFFSVTDLPVLPLAPKLVHLRALGSWFGRAMVGLSRRATRAWMEPVERFRAALGLPAGGHPLFEGQFSPAMTLALFSHVMAEPQPDWPPNVQVTGFVLYNGPGALDAALESFLAEGPAPIVFTLGTSAVGAAGRFYHESVETALRLGARAVLLTGGFPENVPPGPRRPEILFVDRAPHQWLFPRASVVVHQGGIGTTAQALRSGRPMLVVPHSHDQPDNAFRVTNLGVARTLYPGRYQAARVARELQRLLDGEAYRERAAAVAAAVNRERGADAAADALEQLLP
ncbi:MAG TPA: glycosyltransferase [Vicinamibacterales bacterium]|nr:glycosyltransferase [Vicinamibacterales bacterium]